MDFKFQAMYSSVLKFPFGCFTFSSENIYLSIVFKSVCSRLLVYSCNSWSTFGLSGGWHLLLIPLIFGHSFINWSIHPGRVHTTCSVLASVGGIYNITLVFKGFAWHSYSGNKLVVSYKTDKYLSCNPAVSLLGIYLREMKT